MRGTFGVVLLNIAGDPQVGIWGDRKPDATALIASQEIAIAGSSLPARLARSFYRTDRKMMANTTTHPTMTRAATAPAVILSFSLVV